MFLTFQNIFLINFLMNYGLDELYQMINQYSY